MALMARIVVQFLHRIRVMREIGGFVFLRRF
jgi:hypothetical protein